MKATPFLLVAGALLMAACAPRDGTGPSEPVARVELSPTAPVVAVGASIQLTATLRDRHDRVLTGRAVSWSVEPTVALTVSPTGLVAAHLPGTAVVTAASEGKRASVTVSAVGTAVPVASVTLNPAGPVQLLEGDEIKLTAVPRDAEGNPLVGRAVAWSSSDPSIASVAASGSVTALYPGIVEVTATVEGKTATATVEVTNHSAYQLLFNGHEAPAAARLFVVRLGDRAAEPLLPPDVLPGWSLFQAKASPDGQRIAFTGQEGYGEYFTVFVINADGTGLLELGAGEQPTWSPDGTRIAYTVWPWDSDADIWVINADGTGAVNLTGHLKDTDQRDPAWSPELAGGSRIAFVDGDGTQSSIWTMRPDGSDRRRVTTTARAYDDLPGWSPDGARIVFSRYDGLAADRDLWVVGASGGEPAPLVRLPGWQSAPAWSPDGRLIAFASVHEDANAAKIYTVWSDGTKLARRTQGEAVHGSPAWRVYRR